jgi:hypothetical protein
LHRIDIREILLCELPEFGPSGGCNYSCDEKNDLEHVVSFLK